MAEDALFKQIETLQGSRPWGGVLDAGTGKHSLQWVSGLKTARWTAVTCDAAKGEALKKSFGGSMRAEDRLMCRSWTDPEFLRGEMFDVVLADYLLGAVDCYSPYFQHRLFPRLKPHVGESLYVIGLEPYPETAGSPGGKIILEIARWHDACILLAGHRPNREYPLRWTVDALEASGYAIGEVKAFPILYGPAFIHGQLNVCLQKLPRFEDRRLARELERSIAVLGERAVTFCEQHGNIAFGEDYVICARPLK